jgi:predicted transcriptional regulator
MDRKQDKGGIMKKQIGWTEIYASAVGLSEQQVKVMGALHERNWRHATEIVTRCEGMSINQVRRTLRRLLKAGYVEVNGMGHPNRQPLDTNNYWRLA